MCIQRTEEDGAIERIWDNLLLETRSVHCYYFLDVHTINVSPCVWTVVSNMYYQVSSIIIIIIITYGITLKAIIIISKKEYNVIVLNK